MSESSAIQDPSAEIDVAVERRRQRRALLEVAVRAAVLVALGLLVLAGSAVARLGGG